MRAPIAGGIPRREEHEHQPISAPTPRPTQRQAALDAVHETVECRCSSHAKDPGSGQPSEQGPHCGREGPQPARGGNACVENCCPWEQPLDTPADLQKFGYNPSLSSGTANPQTLDPVRNATGISTHLALNIASHVLAKGLTRLKSRSGGRTMAADAPWTDAAADWLGELVNEVHAELGLPAVDAAVIRAAVAKLADPGGSPDPKA